MRYYKSKVVTGTANKETLEEILTSTATEKYHITKLYATETTSTLQNDAYIRVYIERERVVDIPIVHWLDNITTSSRTMVPYIELDITLDVGESLYIGHESQATASDYVYTVEYEIVR